MSLYDNPPYYFSAYGLAVKHGFRGTEQEWLESLKGETGDVWAPSVSEEGELTWEKNGEAAPQPMNIKGPRGEPSTVPGPKGDPGVSPTVSVSKEGGVTTVTITDAEGGHTAEIHDGDVSQETLDAALAEKQNVLTFDDAPTEGSANPVKSGGVWDGLQRKPNRNLLDNWYFLNPVNQRSQDEYTGAVYGIDRWAGLETRTHIKAANDGVQVTKGGVWIQRQPFSYKEIAGKTFTFSVLTAGNELFSCTGTAPADEPSTNIIIANIDFGEDKSEFYRFRYDGAVKKLSYVAIAPGTYADKTYVAAKLELGPVQTLAHKEGDQWVLNDPPPNYQQELAKCQRYFERSILYEGYAVAESTSEIRTAGNYFFTVSKRIAPDPVPNAAVNPTVKEAADGTAYISGCKLSKVHGRNKEMFSPCITSPNNNFVVGRLYRVVVPDKAYDCSADL